MIAVHVVRQGAHWSASGNLALTRGKIFGGAFWPNARRDLVPLWLEKGSLSLPPADVPLVCVGPGTGVAPFRSMLQQRAALQRSQPVAPSLLFFGCRYRDKDYLYADVRHAEHSPLGPLEQHAESGP